MGSLSDIPFDKESADVKNKVTSYWTKRAEGFAATRHDEAHSYKADLWRAELTARLPKASGIGPENNVSASTTGYGAENVTSETAGNTLEDSSVGDEACVTETAETICVPQTGCGIGLQVLDVGCGTGFFEMLLAPLGYLVTGIDLTPDMIEKGRELLARHNISGAELLVMDAENPIFPDGYFDAVISRNLTWNLPHPADAYREWHRVLKPGGVLLNYDAEYAKGFHKYDQAENRAHSNIDSELIEECHDIYHMLSVSTLDRPEWDIGVLKEIGFTEVASDIDAGDRLYGIKDRFYMPDRMFCIRAVK